MAPDLFCFPTPDDSILIQNFPPQHHMRSKNLKTLIILVIFSYFGHIGALLGILEGPTESLFSYFLFHVLLKSKTGMQSHIGLLHAKLYTTSMTTYYTRSPFLAKNCIEIQLTIWTMRAAFAIHKHLIFTRQWWTTDCVA